MRYKNIEITDAHIREMFEWDGEALMRAIFIAEDHKEQLIQHVVKAWKEAGLVLRPNAVKMVDNRAYFCWALPVDDKMFTIDIYFGYRIVEVDKVIPLDKYMHSKGFTSCFDVCPDTEGNGVMILGYKWVDDKCEIRPLRYPRGKARCAYIEDGIVHWCNVTKRRVDINHIEHIKECVKQVLVRLQTNNSGNVQLQKELQELIEYIDQFGA